MLLKKIILFIGFGIILIGPSLAQSPTDTSSKEAFKQQLQQIRDQRVKAAQSGDTQKAQQLKAQEDAMILGRMQQMIDQRLEAAKANPPAPSSDPNVQWQNEQLQLKIQIHDAIKSGDTQKAQQLKAQLVANAQQRFALVRAKREVWLKDHPADAAKRAQEEKFRQSQLPLFFELGAALKSGDTQKAQQIKAQMAANRQQWMKTQQITQNAQPLPATSP
ncbi:MAG: hypothetical protein HQL14_08515 [Candidatus Omnitrophica bacterium]|nr:hypothetical protein [Candidatus Omnitrophota bacterium]